MIRHCIIGCLNYIVVKWTAKQEIIPQLEGRIYDLLSVEFNHRVKNTQPKYPTIGAKWAKKTKISNKQKHNKGHALVLRGSHVTEDKSEWAPLPLLVFTHLRGKRSIDVL